MKTTLFRVKALFAFLVLVFLIWLPFLDSFRKSDILYRIKRAYKEWFTAFNITIEAFKAGEKV